MPMEHRAAARESDAVLGLIKRPIGSSSHLERGCHGTGHVRPKCDGAPDQAGNLLRVGPPIAASSGLRQSKKGGRRRHDICSTLGWYYTVFDTRADRAASPRYTLPMEKPKVVSAAEWQAARDALLVAEKEATHALDAVAAQRRRLPMVKIEQTYVFDSPTGKKGLAIRSKAERSSLSTVHGQRTRQVLPRLHQGHEQRAHSSIECSCCARRKLGDRVKHASCADRGI